jgi:acyl carrier protein
VTVPQISPSAAVLDEIRAILAEVLDASLDDLEITSSMRLIDDLGLESIDLVTIASILTERYGSRVNLAAFLAQQDVDEVIAMTVGGLVEFVTGQLTSRAAE